MSLQRFKAKSHDGEQVIWSKDMRVVHCPYLLQIRDDIYMLVAMVGHKGKSFLGGHYTAMVRDAIDGSWYFCDDDMVSSCHARTSKGGSISTLPDKSNPCILFYQRYTMAGQRSMETCKASNHDSSKQDSPETQAMKECMKTTPKRQQTHPPDRCKLCGRKGCEGLCLQRL